VTDYGKLVTKKPKPPDNRPLWRRILSSVRPDIKFTKKLISYIGIKGKIEF
jgi:hypothetical protein